jgi:hypothetical protein
VKQWLIVILGLCALVACPPSPVTPQPDADAMVTPPADADPFPYIDAAPIPPRDALAPTTACGRACAQLSWLGCEEALPTPKGESCESVCLRANAFPTMQLPTACVIAAQSIPDVRKCPRVKCGAK